MQKSPDYPHTSSLETFASAYVDLAWANGERALQVGRWPQIAQALKCLESGWPGITAAVMAGLTERRKSE